MKERGVIFNSEMVRAILDGRKTQTRRVVKASTSDMLDLQEQYPHKKYNIGCPFGQPGVRLWVRETWGVASYTFDDDGMMIKWTPDRPATAIHEMPFGNGYYSGYVIYAADGEFTWGDDDGYEDGRSCWKPSIHMPRAASRILLEITDVRVERLNDISEEDAIAEGIEPLPPHSDLPQRYHEYFPLGNKNGLRCNMSASSSFAGLWGAIYGDQSWQVNPWVWAIEFRRIEGD